LEQDATSRNQPINASHSAPKFATTKKRNKPDKINKKATAWPTWAASLVERSALQDTVQRVTGNHVEDSQHDVDVTEPDQHGDERSSGFGAGLPTIHPS